ncbi:hypothetical protein Pcinc_024131 [Petrolisthes cinctipes]|uniref:Uncharacterized protein n=1 Tax=Petrolisthes cinctipes TaxID=88211 RepID=A0AAE1FCQ1_PETCI|nr:hypothetical protein Pcinc_024131 [Petrolisthes cinctipes]
MKGGECWVELSTNNDYDEENHIVLDHKCRYDLPEFPQLQLTVNCPDKVEQCAIINFCNTESEATVKTPIHYKGNRTPSSHHTLGPTERRPLMPAIVPGVPATCLTHHHNTRKLRPLTRSIASPASTHYRTSHTYCNSY